MAADRAGFFIPRPRTACNISFSGGANATETAWIMDEIDGADLSFFISGISALAGNRARVDTLFNVNLISLIYGYSADAGIA